ncbi:type IX secretion system ring subunit PorN/GldN [Thermonema rossianum]|jgi:gliding motility associated protien GldN|uniref:type IX secretion system ring protein PorN/GldN n=1 Tax=Thermonema rossianum TaxID=55505 RepID=UPI0009FFA563|nr:gliding motility protein GldN [Thermonema rossianum]
MRRGIGILMLLCLLSVSAWAQYGYNPLALHPVLEDDIMFRRVLTRVINLREKQNRPFAAVGHHIAQEIIWAVDSGYVTAYSYPDERMEVSLSDSAWRSQIAERDEFDVYLDLPMDPSNISVLEITEEVIFDKRRSRMYINILSLALVAPGYNKQAGGTDLYIARFKYKELAEYFRKKYEESNQTRCLWYNPQNNRRHMCLTDAFELRLFSSRIVKISNPDDLFIAEYPELQGNIEAQLYKSREIEYELMEFEHNLWEF